VAWRCWSALAKAMGGFMKRLLIVGVLLLSTASLCAQAQRPNATKLKADAQKVVSDIRGDKAKIKAYCQINSLGAQMVEAAQEKDSEKAEALFQRVDDLEKQLGPQYHALFDALYDADPNSEDVQDILSMFNKLDESCPR
jgi:molybdopterin converting factor small subunit